MLIFLIGYMGCGKSSLGKPLSGLMNYKFIDLDSYIEQECGMRIPDLFAHYGESYFRKEERRCLIELCENEENCVISTGGGTPCYEDNMEIMNRYGITVYINLEKTILISRLLTSKKKRPLIESMDEEQLREFIEKSLSIREPFYNKATINITGRNIKPYDISLFISSYDKRV
ncbi:MAG: shikimate kinase [Rikenellaceae bacterium]